MVKKERATGIASGKTIAFFYYLNLLHPVGIAVYN
jgi:hypothetical protein